jgi:aspartyl-tRNA(Asn)/glutamyl-tRNA(Gln) amidotransferase subunit B
VRYLDICDGNMEEGSMRCDANISVRKKGDTILGNRCEVKNLNSIRNVQRAIEFEVIRQIDVIEAGGHIDQNTLNYDAVSGTTSVLRSKEMANDYRYFPEPDLPPVILTDAYIDEVKHNMPALPDELFKKFINEFKLSEYDAHNILEQKEIALYYIEITNHTTNYKGAANWLMGAVKSYLNEAAVDIADFPLKPAQIAELVSIVDEGKINITTANQQLFPALLKDNTKTALSLATELNLIISTSNDDVLAFIHEAMAKYPDKVAEYKAGKKSLTGLFMGEVMKLAKGKLDPKEANKLLAQELER